MVYLNSKLSGAVDREGIMQRPFVYTGVEGMGIFVLDSHRKSLFLAKINHSSVEFYLQQHGEQSRSVKLERIQRGKAAETYK